MNLSFFSLFFVSYILLIKIIIYVFICFFYCIFVKFIYFCSLWFYRVFLEGIVGFFSVCFSGVDYFLDSFGSFVILWIFFFKL